MSVQSMLTKSIPVTAAAVGLLLALSPAATDAAVNARICATREQVQAFTGTTDVKVVFITRDTSYTRRNVVYYRHALHYVDFSQQTPAITTIISKDSAFHPIISPDGQYVAYQRGTDSEGSAVENTASVWLRKLAAGATPVKVADTGFMPRFVDAASEPTVIYTTSITCTTGTLPPWSTTLGVLCHKRGETQKREVRSGAILQAAQTVWANGSYYGGVSYDGRYLCTGWPPATSPFMIDLHGDSVNPQPLHIITLTNRTTGRDSTVTTSTSNPSRSASRIFTNTMLYLDNGVTSYVNANYTTPLGQGWDEHQFLFISRMAATKNRGEMVRALGMPADQQVVPATDANAKGLPVKKLWMNPEWSNHPYYAAAGLAVDRLFKDASPDLPPGYQHSKWTEGVYLVDLKQRYCLRLITATDTSIDSGSNFMNPSVWVRPCEDFVEDPTWLSVPDLTREELPTPTTAIAPLCATSGAIDAVHASRMSRPTAGVAVILSARGEIVWQSDGRESPSGPGFHLPRLGPGVYFLKNLGPRPNARTERIVVR